MRSTSRFAVVFGGLVVALLLAIVPTFAAARPSFVRLGTYPTGRGSGDVAIGHLNDDRLPDLVTANVDSSTVSVLLGRRTGGFLRKRDFATGRSPHGLATADFDGDRRPDVATADAAARTVSVLMNNGRGGLRPRDRYSVPGSPTTLAAADLTGDGKVDIVVPSNVRGTKSVLTVFRNQGGHFVRSDDYEVGSYTTSVAIGDFNRDGSRDVVTTDYQDGSLSVLLNKGDGSLRPRVRYDTARYPGDVAARDLNGDRRPDLVVTHELIGEGSNVFVWFNRRRGRFRIVSFFPGGREPGSVAIGHLNRDRAPDLAIYDIEGGGWSIFLNEGYGIFSASGEYGTRKTVYRVAIADVKRDGRGDLAISHNGAVSLLLNTTGR